MTRCASLMLVREAQETEHVTVTTIEVVTTTSVILVCVCLHSRCSVLMISHVLQH